MTVKALVILCGISMISCVSFGSDAGDLGTLVVWMTGSFSSEHQASADSSYYDIRLEMVEIWTERPDGRWLYVEQAAAGHLDRPYRQRVYHVTEIEPGRYGSEVYSIPDPLRFAGAWKHDSPLSRLTPDSLEIRDGCRVELTMEADDTFAGGTVGTGCASKLRGASYATSEVRVGRDRIESWDRGFDETGTHVWGAESGPYLFLRKESPEKENSD